MEMLQHGSSVVASALAGQLGSSPKFLTKREHDMRILSVIKDEEIPMFVYARIRGKKSPAWNIFYDEVLHLKRSVGGRGLRDIIRMEMVSHGGATELQSEIDAVRPGWLGRNITNRNWQEKAELEGKV